MAEQERKVILKVETGESQKTVKGLKQDISDLKDAILNLEQGTDEYNDAVKQLQDAQRDLNRVQSLTKESAVALEGSYDALTHQMALLKKEWKATNDEARRNELGKQIDEINDQLKEFDSSIGNFQRNVGNYESALNGLNIEQKDFGTAMREMNESIEPTKQGFEAVGNLASGLASGFAVVQGAAALLGTENENLEKTFVKLQAAMALMQGVSGLKGLVEGAGKAKVALAQLGQSATAAGGGLKGLMKVMGKSGWVAIILAVVAAFTALFKNLPMVKEQQSRYEAQIRSTIRQQELFKSSIETTNSKLKDKLELLRAQGVEERKLLEIALAQAKTNEDEAAKKYLDANKQRLAVESAAKTMAKGAFKSVYSGMNPEEAIAHYKQLEENAKKYRLELKAVREGIEQNIKELDAKEAAAFDKRMQTYADSLKSKEQLLREQYAKDLADAKKFGKDATVIHRKFKKDLEELYKSNGNGTNIGDFKEDPNITLKNSIKERIQLENQATQRKLANLDVERNKEIENAYATINDKDKLEAELERIEQLYAGKEYEIEQELLNKKLVILNEWKTANTDANIQKLEIAEEIADTEVEIEQSKQDRLTEIAKQGNKDRNSNQTTGTSGGTETSTDDVQQGLGLIDDFKQQVKDFDEQWKSMNFTQKAAEIGNVVATSLQGASQIFNQLADMYANEEDLSEEEIKKVKNLRIAGATMDMLSGIVGAIGSAAGMGPVGWALGAIQAGIIATTGALNIAAIKKQDISGNSSSGTGAFTPNIGSYSSELPASYTRNITTSSEVDELNKDTRVYILESDIQESNRKVSVRENESSF